MDENNIAAFNVALKELLTQYKFALSAEPYIDGGRIMARPVVVPKPDELEQPVAE
jgi:hypothetical protein